MAANHWTCFKCKTNNDLEDDMRQVGPSVCVNCGTSRYFLHGLAAFGLFLLVALAGGVAWLLGMPERNYRAKYVEAFKNDGQIDTKEQTELDKLAKKYNLPPETVARVQSQVMPPPPPGPIVETAPNPKPPEPPKPTPTDADVKVEVAVFRKNAQGQQVGVPSGFPFRIGDQIRIGVSCSRDGFLYLVQQGTSGRMGLLFPHKRIAGGANQVMNGRAVVVPSEGWFNFDRTPGTETIYVVFSTKRDDVVIGNIEAATKSGIAVLDPDKESQVLRDLQKLARDLTVGDPAQPDVVSPMVLSGSGKVVGVLKLTHE